MSEDVAVVGFDDSPVAADTDPPLTSVRRPLEEMGRKMARLLIARLTGESEAEIKLVLRPDWSSGSPPKESVRVKPLVVAGWRWSG
ncbi:hypothetical protein GCM10010304_63720 [Streptomyces roseoviolaceus]